MAQIRVYATDVELTFTETTTVAGQITATQADITYSRVTGRMTAVQAALNYQPTAVVVGSEVITGNVGASVVQSSVTSFVAPDVVAGTRRLT